MADKDVTYIDPVFSLPPNVIDFRYTDKESVNTDPEEVDYLDTAQGEDVIVNVDSDSTTATNPEDGNVLPVPETITVVSQTVKAAPGGGYLVDIIVDIPNMNGVETYDVAVTKA